MSDALPEKFDLVFRGQLAKGFDPETAKKNLGQLFKISTAKVEALFSGKPVTLKRGLSAESANKYRVAIKKAGALVELVEDKPAEKRGKAVFTASTEAGSTSVSGMGAIPGTQSAAAAISGTEPLSAAGEADDGGLSLAPLGTAVLTTEERKPVELRQVDTSRLSLRPPGKSLLDASEYRAVPAAREISSTLELAAPGADVLTPKERKAEVIADIDISGLELDDSGENLAPAVKTPPPPPDVSGISLEKV